MQREVDDLLRPPLDNPGVLLEWEPGAYDASEYGYAEPPVKRRPSGVDDDLDGWEPVGQRP